MALDRVHGLKLVKIARAVVAREPVTVQNCEPAIPMICEGPAIKGP